MPHPVNQVVEADDAAGEGGPGAAGDRGGEAEVALTEAIERAVCGRVARELAATRSAVATLATEISCVRLRAVPQDTVDSLGKAVARHAKLTPVDVAPATWTLVRTELPGYAGEKLFAVGAAHCALYFKTVGQGTTTPVFVPKAIASVAEAVWVPRGYAEPETAARVVNDMVVVELAAGGGASVAELEAVPVPFAAWSKPPRLEGLKATIGAGESSAVLGDRPHYVPSAWRTYEDCYVFVETQGEPGNSGALMVGQAEDGTVVPLGVYFGVAGGMAANAHARGVIVPFHRGKSGGDLERHACVPKPTHVTVQTASGVDATLMVKGRGKRFAAIAGHWCVFIETRFPLAGEVACGSVGCGMGS